MIYQDANGFQPLIRKIDLLMGELKTLKNSSIFLKTNTNATIPRYWIMMMSILDMLTSYWTPYIKIKKREITTPRYIGR